MKHAQNNERGNEGDGGVANNIIDDTDELVSPGNIFRYRSL